MIAFVSFPAYENINKAILLRRYTLSEIPSIFFRHINSTTFSNDITHLKWTCDTTVIIIMAIQKVKQIRSFLKQYFLAIYFRNECSIFPNAKHVYPFYSYHCAINTKICFPNGPVIRLSVIRRVCSSITAQIKCYQWRHRVNNLQQSKSRPPRQANCIWHSVPFTTYEQNSNSPVMLKHLWLFDNVSCPIFGVIF